MAKIQNAANSTEESIGIAMSRTELFFEKNGKALTLGLIVLVLPTIRSRSTATTTAQAFSK